MSKINLRGILENAYPEKLGINLKLNGEVYARNYNFGERLMNQISEAAERDIHEFNTEPFPRFSITNASGWHIMEVESTV